PAAGHRGGGRRDDRLIDRGDRLRDRSPPGRPAAGAGGEPAAGGDHRVSDPTASATPAISLQGVRKSFGRVVAVGGISLDIADGEFLTLLGPSGCGKTTTMRMIAGFEEPDEGRILLRGRDVVGVPPNKRDVNMCFQHYALFPHMSVQENVEYGLKLRKVPREERRRRVAEMLEVVRLEGFEKRKPAQL